jgi:hypothetical protein
MNRWMDGQVKELQWMDGWMDGQVKELQPTRLEMMVMLARVHAYTFL